MMKNTCDNLFYTIPYLAWGKLDQGPARTVSDWNMFNVFPMDDRNAVLSQIEGGHTMYDNEMSSASK